MKRFALASIATAMVFTSCLVQAAPLSVKANVTFKATGKPGFIHIDGQDATATGTLDRGAGGVVAGIINCKLTDLHTGIGLRDEHMQTKYLETGKYPSASLALDPVAVKDGDTLFSGKLTLHGVTNPVSGTIHTAGSAFRATFTVTLSDFKIDVPTYMGVTVAKTVDVTVAGSAK